MGIILAICALVGGYFFLKYFDRIDASLFGSTDENYESFGMITVAICCFAGAVAAGGAFIESMFNFGWKMQSIHLMAAYIGAFCLAYCVYNAIVRMQSVGAIIGKILFMWVACGIGGLVGALGAVAVICVLILVAVLYVLAAVLSGNSSSGKKSWKASDGTVIEESKGICGESYYQGNDGRNYDKVDDTTFREK